MFRKLSHKLIALLTLIVIAGSGMTLLVVTITTGSQFRHFVKESDRRRAEQLSRVFAAYYQSEGSFNGVDRLLATPGSDGTRDAAPERAPDMGGMMRGMSAPMGQMMFDMAAPEPLLLTSTDGRVVADTVPGRVPPDAGELARKYGVPVTVNGRGVGWLLFGSMIDSTFNPLQIQFLHSLRLAVVISAVTSALLAVLFGSLFLAGLVRPLRDLTGAAESITRGQMDAPIPVRGRDELAALASSFRTMRDTLVETQQSRRQMFRDIAHELRTPVTLLHGEVEAMLDGVYEITPESVRSLQEEIDILGRLISDVRLISSMDNNDFQLVREPTDVGALLTRVGSAFGKSALQAGITIETHVSPDLPPVTADRERLIQVISNLVLNAIHHAAGSDTLVLSALPSGTAQTDVHVTVSDNGRGIAAEDLPHIFDRLYRADRSRNRKTGGSGLGLAIARQIVEAHGGTIRAESSPGEGTTIHIILQSG